MTFSVLVVCTGNLCRSPALEALLRTRFGDRLAVSSAGTHAVLGAPVHPLTAAALSEHGVPVPDHQARQLDGDLVRAADLVLTATRAHRAAVVDADPDAVPRTFTVAELARLAAPAPDWPQWRAAAAGRRGTPPPGPPDLDDLADPIAGGPAEHRRMVATAADLVERLTASAP